MPVQNHGLVCNCGEGVAEEGSNPTRSICDQQQRTEWFQAQQHGDVQALEERGANATQVASATLCHEARRAEFEEVTSFWLARQHFIDGQQNLIWLHFWSEVAQVLNWTGCLRSTSSKHALPISPRHALRRTNLLGGDGRIDGSVEFR